MDSTYLSNTCRTNFLPGEVRTYTCSCNHRSNLEPVQNVSITAALLLLGDFIVMF